MQWTHHGAHYLLQTRTAVLNGELRDQFEWLYPEMGGENGVVEPSVPLKIAA